MLAGPAPVRKPEGRRIFVQAERQAEATARAPRSSMIVDALLMAWGTSARAATRLRLPAAANKGTARAYGPRADAAAPAAPGVALARSATTSAWPAHAGRRISRQVGGSSSSLLRFFLCFIFCWIGLMMREHARVVPLFAGL